MLRDLSFDLIGELNKVQIDKFGRVSAFLAINKPMGVTSHDIVDEVRKKLGTRQVGHVGALDPDAEGVMLILVGKRYTRLSDELMNLDKTYRMVIGFGFGTDSLDLDGKILNVDIPHEFDLGKLRKIIDSFEGGYEQYVPIYSSVKVNGNKLRVLARKYEHFRFVDQNGEKFVIFEDQQHTTTKLAVPHKRVDLYDFEFINTGETKVDKFVDVLQDKQIPFVELSVGCSKGTYVRQLAYDIGAEYGCPATLLHLQRTRIGSIFIDHCIDLENLKY